MESGEFFRERGVANFTEGDFFAWYCDEWTPSIAHEVKRLIAALSEFDPASVEQAPERVRDLLKRLYHGLFPREVRHDLGEFYTPDWLAERLLMQLDNELFGDLPRSAEKRRQQAERVARRLTETRFLDPACGSGTFLVLIIRRLRQWAREAGVSERDQLMPALLRNVIGFDLNPLAVISSRANFLLSIADLLAPSGEPIELPIYLADSIVLPAEGQGETLFEAGRGVYELPLRGVGKKFLVPAALATRPHLNALARLLRRDVSKNVGPQAFLRACQGEFALSAHEWRRCEEPLRELYNTLSELHRGKRNGLWADIARNMFMPLFVSPADFVVGNPPWVNWENLPQPYRDRSKPLWQHYGLFELKGYEAQLGKSQDDISMLLTYVASDLYLKAGGTLGFVITQTVFKTGAGQGFRRFQLGTREPLRVLTVDDFSSLKPFEEAANRTGLLVLEKGGRTRYPVTYYVWRKKGRRGPAFTSTWRDVYPADASKRLIERATQSAEPISAEDATSPWITAPRKGLRAVRKVLGRSDYRARKGADAIGANAVYWLRILRQNRDGTVQVQNITQGARREIESGVHTIEPDLLYPLLRGRNVKKWAATPEADARFLITHFAGDRLNPIPLQVMQAQYPRTLAYLVKHEETLRQRKSQAVRRLMRDAAFYAMFALGDYTFAPYKVAWPEIAAKFYCCVVEGSWEAKCVVPDHKLVFLPCEDRDEAHYSCAVLNSSAARFGVQSYSISAQFAPSILERIRVPKYETSNPIHGRLADLSRQAHAITAGETAGILSEVEQQIDECAARLWGLTGEELAVLQAALNEQAA